MWAFTRQSQLVCKVCGCEQKCSSQGHSSKGSRKTWLPGLHGDDQGGQRKEEADCLWVQNELKPKPDVPNITHP